jgi:hypothetical protein
VLLQRFDRRSYLHARLVDPVKVLGLNRRFHVFYKLLYRRPCLNGVIRLIRGLLLAFSMTIGEKNVCWILRSVPIDAWEDTSSVAACGSGILYLAGGRSAEGERKHFLT